MNAPVLKVRELYPREDTLEMSNYPSGQLSETFEAYFEA